MDEFYSLVHREAGPLLTFLTKREANNAFAAVLRDEPAWRDDYTLEAFQLMVAEAEERR